MEGFILISENILVSVNLNGVSNNAYIARVSTRGMRATDDTWIIFKTKNLFFKFKYLTHNFYFIWQKCNNYNNCSKYNILLQLDLKRNFGLRNYK
jgi:hypothetical protein